MRAFKAIGRKAVLKSAALALLAANAYAADKTPPAKPSVSDVVKASKPSDWRPLDPENTLYMDIPSGRVVIELAPTFAPNHVKNIKALVREHYFDGLAIIRSQDNWVVQWGDPNEENGKPREIKNAQRTLKAEFTVPIKNDKNFTRLPDHDGYAPQAGHSNGFPVGHDPKKGEAWLAHCYGMVGVGRDNDADSGGGTSLYAVIGHGPRHLDRNITVVGRVISGMPLLSTLPRGAGPMGFYDKPELNVPISSVKVAADVPEAERSKFEVMRTDSATYQAVVEAQRNRGGPWTKVPAGYIDLCNTPIPVREQK
ncbi:peptidylprolyl isomerase [Massilia horti]|uniref:peptidylprolyl isomerase n=1 Tax=Massilia horti TaxID=2562153 RepID=A0A4Y9SQF3_9BURK|nr:peptidylprolyl isomerase [Massilia horti]TFW28768.1 peptidylprolyl isomerase [Massilia horti]